VQNFLYNRHLSELPPVATAHLFPIIGEKLIELLVNLSPEDWTRTAVKQWTVKDLAAHLLDSTLRRLSIGRDNYFGEPFRGSTPEELRAFLGGLNHSWVDAARRLSPRVLCNFLTVSDDELSQYFASLDPNGPALFGVSWAGEDQSLNWFDIAREYTEKWHHQQQIREATARPGIMTEELYGPVLDVLVRALPHAYRDVPAAKSTTIEFRISGVGGGTWLLVRNDDYWFLRKGSDSAAQCRISVQSELAWKHFTNGLGEDEARSALRFDGDATLAEPVYSARAIAT
jgi:uncharacterized protein (TIGR03083 family)